MSEKKVEAFVQAAKEISWKVERGDTGQIHRPCSGTPHYSEHTNTSMFETDEKSSPAGLQNLGFGMLQGDYTPRWSLTRATSGAS